MQITTATFKTWRLLASIASMIVLVSCVTVTPPSDLLDQAQAQLQQAQNIHANARMPKQVHNAEIRLDAAKDAMAQKNYTKATYLARESLVDARLAQLTTQLAAEKERVKAKRDENAHLKDKINARRSGSNASSGSQSRENGGLPEQMTLPAPALSNSTPIVDTTRKDTAATLSQGVTQ